MICENCRQRAATVLFNANINGNKISKHLCQACADLEQSEINSVLEKAMQNLAPSLMHRAAKPVKKVCSSCGTSLEQLGNTGFVGCSNCYKVFELEVREMLGKMQGATVHICR